MSKKRNEDLEQNELADRLEEQFDKVKPYLPIIGAVIGAILLAVVGGMWYFHSQKAKKEAVWQELGKAVDQSTQLAGSTSALISFAEDNPDTDAALWAKFFAGDMEIKYALRINDPRTGKPAWIENKKKSINGLKKAKTYLKDVVGSDRDMDKLLRRRATYALAYAHECLGEFAEAKKLYDQLIEEGEKSPLFAASTRGSSRCGNPRVKEFFTMFNSWESFGDAPDDVELPAVPDIDFDDKIVGPISGGGSFEPKITDPAPKPGDNKKADDKKADDKKADDKKADDKKADDKKADDKKADDKKAPEEVSLFSSDVSVVR